MGRNQTLAILFAIIAVHIALAAAFASMTPYRKDGLIFSNRGAHANDIGAPDERQHVNYIARLVHGNGFAVLDPKDPNLYEHYQAHQPPAFYVLAAGWATVTGIDIPPPPPGNEGREMSVDDGVKLRALNVVIGSFTIAGVYMLAFWGYRRVEGSLTAAAFAALLPMNVALSGAVSNDPLLICLCTWALAMLFHAMHDGWTVKRAVILGLLAGLAILTKSTGVALLPAILLGAVISRKPTGDEAVTPTKPIHWVAALVPLLLLVVPWWLRNMSLYGDPLAMKAFKQSFTGSAQASMFIEGMGPLNYWKNMVFAWTAESFVGVFGYMDIWLTNTGMRGGSRGIYWMCWGLLLVAALGWISGLRHETTEGKRLHLVNGTFFLVVVVMFLGFNATYFQAQARYLLPALGPISCGVGFGLISMFRNRVGTAFALTVLIFGLADGFALTHLPNEFAQRMGIAQRNP